MVPWDKILSPWSMLPVFHASCLHDPSDFSTLSSYATLSFFFSNGKSPVGPSMVSATRLHPLDVCLYLDVWAGAKAPSTRMDGCDLHKRCPTQVVLRVGTVPIRVSLPFSPG